MIRSLWKLVPLLKDLMNESPKLPNFRTSSPLNRKRLILFMLARALK